MTGIKANAYDEPWMDVFTLNSSPGAVNITAADYYLNNSIRATPAAGSVQGFLFDPALWQIPEHDLKLRCIYAVKVATSVGLGRQLDFSMRKITSLTDGGGGALTIVNLGSPITGTELSVPDPGPMGDFPQQALSAIAAPVAGDYAVGFSVNGAWTANSRAYIRLKVQVKNIYQ